jgi:hypothetical protein
VAVSVAGLVAAVAGDRAPVDLPSVATSGTCVDGGGVRWVARVGWGYASRADGAQRMAPDYAGWTTSRAGPVPTDSSIRISDRDGVEPQSLEWTGRVDYGAGADYEVRHLDHPVSASGPTEVTVSLGVDGDGMGSCTIRFVEPWPAGAAAPEEAAAGGGSGGVVNLPAQPASIVYGGTGGTSAYAHPGGLVVAGRDNYADQDFKDVSAGGGTVLIYLDPVIDASYGRYHEMLNESSVCGPATSRWPGGYKANGWGYLNDFREGSVLQDKFECVLEKMVAENPQMGGWFLDDVGSRSWFPGFDWGDFPDKAGYRAGAVALTQTMRKVANEHGLIFIVNGTWTADDGGGYPDVSKSGNALADGGFVEHHDSEVSYFASYACSSQWAAQSPVTRGKAVNYAVTYTAAALAEYARSDCFAYVSQQREYDPVAPWGGFHPTGLPSRVES